MQPHRGTHHRDDAWSDVRDEQLLDLASRGDAAAVDAFVARFGERVQGLLVRIVRDHAWADDLLQEVLVRALRDAHRFDDRWPMAVWLFRIARNLALDLLRREGRHRRRNDAAAARDAAAPAAVTTAEHREFQVALEDALQELPEAFRTVFLLRDGEGLSYEEIAAVLSISAKTVSSRLHRARQQLRALLQEHLER
jgi:RNA polymerase sigma-70 factor (ECF subfamily)